MNMKRQFKAMPLGMGLLIAFFFLTPVKTFAQTSILLQEDFSEGFFPPNGWTTNTGDFGGFAWFGSSGGPNGEDGSAMSDVFDENQGTLTSPTIDASQYAVPGGSVTLDFDLWSEYDYYNDQYGSDYLDVYAVSNEVGFEQLA